MKLFTNLSFKSANLSHYPFFLKEKEAPRHFIWISSMQRKLNTCTPSMHIVRTYHLKYGYISIKYRHLWMYVHNLWYATIFILYVRARVCVWLTYRKKTSNLAQTLVSSTRLSPVSSIFSNLSKSSKFNPWRSSPLICLLWKGNGINIIKYAETLYFSN